MIASIGLAILAAEPTFDDWGPYLATLTAWERAGLGLLAGTTAAAPLLLLRFSTRLPLVAPLVFYCFSAWIYLTVMWFPGRGGRTTSRSISAEYYRSEADWYIVTSVLAFHLAIPLMIMLARGRRRPDDEPVPGMIGKRGR